jgi:L-malate glycosyltransferase
VKILLLCHEYPPLGGGGGVGAQQYAEAWVQKGHTVTVITSQVNDLPRHEQQNGVEIVRVFAPGVKRRAMVPFITMIFYCFFSFFHMLRRLTTYRRYDVINTHFAQPNGLLGLTVAKLLGIPNLLTIIGGDIYDPSKKTSPHRSRLLRAANRFILDKSHKVVAISSDTKRRAEQYYQPQRPITVINYGFIPAYYDEVTLDVVMDEAKFNLMAVGRLVPRKGFPYLVRAMALLPADVQLYLVGDGPLENELKALAAELGVSGKIQFMGYKTRGEIYHYLRRADCFVLSSLHEGLGIVVQEAMDAGLPVVATNNGGQVDLIKPPHNGLLVDIESPGQLAAAVQQLYDDRALAADMGRQNAEDIKRLYMSHNAQEYLDLFRALTQADLGEVVARPPFTKRV